MKKLKKLIEKNKTLLFIYLFIKGNRIKGDISSNILNITRKLEKVKIKILGEGNYIEIKENTKLINCKIRVLGKNNSLMVEENCLIKNSDILLDTENSKIIIRKNTTIEGVKIDSQEPYRIEIGEDCMISYNVEIRNTDSHKIIDVNTNQEINRGKPVIIGKHVWLGEGVRVLKGVTIGNGSIIGINTIVTKNITENVIAVGNPAKIIKENCRWEREKNK